MNVAETSAVPAEVIDDAQLIAECVAAGRPTPAEVAHRVREDAKRITRAVYEKYGVLDIAVPTIRELRDAE